jgi:triphosphatase
MGRDKVPPEVEWQFDALDLRPVERWLSTLRTLLIAAGEERAITTSSRPPQRIVDSFLDTDDWRMARAGFIVRTRRRGRDDEITLKATGAAPAGGPPQHLQVTETLPEDGVDGLGTAGPVGRRVHAVAGRRPLRPVLQARTRRRSFSLRVGPEDAGEIALDDTLLVVGNGQRPMQLRRVEVVLRPEWAGALRAIVEQFRAACGLQPATLSPFEAGLLALGVVIPGPPDLGATEIGAGSTMGELAYAVLRRQLTVLRATEPGTRLGEDPEELHDMRVATRRLRAALDLFVDVLPVRARTFRAELGWLAGVLGVVRDLDVQLQTQTAMTEPGQPDPWAELTALLLEEREVGRSEMLAALDSVRFERLMSGMAAMVQQGPLRRPAAIRLPAQLSVPDLIETRHGAVVKAARRARRSGKAADFHRLRIRCKRLRYSLEFSADLYGGGTNRFTRQLTALQDQLGLLQDAEVAMARLADLAAANVDLPAATVFMMGGVAEQHRREMSRLLRQLPKEVSRVGGRAWQDLASAMEDGRTRLLAQVPPVRRVLRALPVPSAPADAGTVEARPMPSLVLTEAQPAQLERESPA